MTITGLSTLEMATGESGGLRDEAQPCGSRLFFAPTKTPDSATDDVLVCLYHKDPQCRLRGAGPALYVRGCSRFSREMLPDIVGMSL